MLTVVNCLLTFHTILKWKSWSNEKQGGWQQIVLRRLIYYTGAFCTVYGPGNVDLLLNYDQGSWNSWIVPWSTVLNRGHLFEMVLKWLFMIMGGIFCIVLDGNWSWNNWFSMHGVSLHCGVLKCLKNVNFWAGVIYEIVNVDGNLLVVLQAVYVLSGWFLEAVGGNLGRGYSCLWLPLSLWVYVLWAYILVLSSCYDSKHQAKPSAWLGRSVVVSMGHCYTWGDKLQVQAVK